MVTPIKIKQIYTCPGSPECGITKCQHYQAHLKTDGCDNDCFDTSGCLVKSVIHGELENGRTFNLTPSWLREWEEEQHDRISTTLGNNINRDIMSNRSWLPD